VKAVETTGREVTCTCVCLSVCMCVSLCVYLCVSVCVWQAFRPVAECAKEVIRDNGYDGHIKLIAKRSTELTVGPCNAAVFLLLFLPVCCWLCY